MNLSPEAFSGCAALLVKDLSSLGEEPRFINPFFFLFSFFFFLLLVFIYLSTYYLFFAAWATGGDDLPQTCI